ncbi:hypothetical protein D7V97_03375 [Corallococcus sp. CA053C]|uniref:hypothetical protein n=1 Tax=Corallococcus sp. CA053C TaxID=2316732 RepID=UPI000ECCBFC9|nr:hypothetical protein [Corallococcus sp. CA053C]RKH14335.1 hypothetical protein D7V97_03375 [Corallococcus sp. CA053C]
MALHELTSRDAVLAAIAKYRELGRDAFLRKYGYLRARRYFLSYDGELFDSKAIVGAAFGIQYPDRGPLTHADFSGGDATVRARLEALGFAMSVKASEGPAPDGSKEQPRLEVGRVYSWDELGEIFHCKPAYFGSAGGMISRPMVWALILITHIGGAKSFDYDDHWEGKDLIYTGRGQTGDQRMEAQNSYLARNQFTNFVFEGAGTYRLRFLGLAQCAQHWWSTGPDSTGATRRIIRFRLRFDAGAEVEAPEAVEAVAPARTRRRTSFTPRPFDEAREPAPFVQGDAPEPLEETLARKEKAAVDHHRLLAALNRALGAAGWSIIEEMPGAVDLWARRPADTRRVIFEAKTLIGKNEVHQTRSALSQLLEYRHFHGEPDDLLCLVTNAPVSDTRERFLRSQGVAVLMYDGTAFEAAGPLALEMIGTLSQRQ